MVRGRSVGFSRDGGHAVITSDAALHFVSLHDQAPAVVVPLGQVQDVATVGDQIWVAAGNPVRLHRFTRRGDVVAEPIALEGHLGVLRAAATGALAAVWTASPITLVSESGASRIPGDPDCVVPVSHRRWLICVRDRIALRDLMHERWAIASLGGRVVDGAALFEGRSVALVLAAPSGSLVHLVVLGLHDGALHQRIALTGIDLVRFAPARGHAVLRTGRRTLVFVDLRFGRVLGEHHEQQDIVDLAIDEAARSVMLRFGGGQGDVTLVGLRELLRSAPPPTVVQDELRDEVPAAVTPDPSPGVTVDFHCAPGKLDKVLAIPPRAPARPMPAANAMELLDRHRDLVAALVGRAIAMAWNDGRLTFPNETKLPFKAEVVGLLGGDTNHARKELEAAEQRVTQASQALRNAEAIAGTARPPLAALAAEFGLSPIACQILMVVAAPGLWGTLARLYGILSNDEARPLVDELLVSQVLARDVSAYDVARELDREAPLVRHGLVQVGGGKMRPFLPLRCEPVVLRLLRGDDGTSDLESVRVIDAVRSFDALLIPARTKEQIIDAVAVAPPRGPARIVVRGREGSGRHTLLATLAAACGRRVGVIDATLRVRDLKLRAEELRSAIRRAHVLGLLPCIDGLETIPSEDQPARDVVREILDDHPGPLAVRLPWDAQPPIAPGYIVIDLPPLSLDQRTTCWRIVLAAHELDVREPEEIAARYGIGPGVIEKACLHVAGLRRDRRVRDVDVVVQLEQTIRQHLETRLRVTASRVTRLATWSKIVLPPDIQDSVLELIARIKHRRTVYDVWGFDQVLTTARGVTALFAGGPGTGKTLVASAIANELGMDLYRVDLSRIMSKWIGETEQNLAKLFDAAEDGHAIILFDEADSLFAKRTEVRSSVDRYANLEVNYLLQRLDTFEGIAILTTNFGTAIDRAFKRRLSFRMTFPFPDEDARESLWRSHIPVSVPRAGSFDFADLARRYRLSGGYIRNAALRAAFIAAEQHAPLTQDHLEQAVKAEFREIGKIADSGVLE